MSPGKRRPDQSSYFRKMSLKLSECHQRQTTHNLLFRLALEWEEEEEMTMMMDQRRAIRETRTDRSESLNSRASASTTTTLTIFLLLIIPLKDQTSEVIQKVTEEEEMTTETEIVAISLPQILTMIHRPVLLMRRNYTSLVVVSDTWTRQRIHFLQFLLHRNKLSNTY